LFLSGLVSRRGTDNAPVPGTVDVQMRTVFDNARALVDTAGFSLSDVASVRVYVTDAGLADSMNAVYREYFAANPPARTTVRAGLTSPTYLVEVTLLADRSKPRRMVAEGVGVAAGPRLFLSGVTGIPAGTSKSAGAENDAQKPDTAHTTPPVTDGQGSIRPNSSVRPSQSPRPPVDLDTPVERPVRRPLIRHVPHEPLAGPRTCLRTSLRARRHAGRHSQ
jgi:2-iminobutanoate/2-iminopropanoate deaminase